MKICIFQDDSLPLLSKGGTGQLERETGFRDYRPLPRVNEPSWSFQLSCKVLTADANFDFTMDSDGHITPMSQLSNAPQVSNMYYQGDKITATVTYMGHSLDMTFRQPDEEQETMLEGIWEFLVKNGLVIGGDYDEVETGISDEQATEPSRARRR